MEVRFQRVNHRTGNESVLLKFRGVVAGQTACVLVDSGRGVDVSAQLEDDEHLVTVLVTHAHADHVRSLGENVGHGVPVLAAEPTAAALANALDADDRADDGADAALDGLEGLSGWRTILGDDAVRVHPVPAGHAPGASGFLVQFRDDDVVRHLLVTGDFTTTQVAGYPSLPSTLPVNVEAMLVNVATAEDYEGTLQSVIETTLAHALEGRRTLLTARPLAAVHLARLLDAVVERFALDASVRAVGRPATLYAALDLPSDDVEVTPEYADPDAVLDAGTITVGSPETPAAGDAKRLFAAIERDADAALVQATTGAHDAATPAACRTDAFELRAHPTADDVDAVVEGYDPLHVVVAHEDGPALDAYKDEYAAFVWANQDAIEQTLYADGDWRAPPWVSERAERYVHGNTADADGTVLDDERTLDADLPAVAADDVCLDAEGVDVAALADRFGSTLPTAVDESAESDADDRLDAVLTRLDAIESRLAERASVGEPVPVTVDEFGDRTVLVLPETVHVEDGDDVDVYVDEG